MSQTFSKESIKYLQNANGIQNGIIKNSTQNPRAPLISFLIGFVLSIQLLNHYPTLSHYSLHCLIASFLIALFLLKTFEHLNTTIWFILFILSVSLAGITYISLKVSTETHLFTTELPTSREFHGIVKIKESLKKNPNYPNTLFIAQFIKENSNNRLKDNERILMIVQKLPFPALEKQSNEGFPSDWIQVAFWCLLIFSYHMNSKKHLSGLLIPVIVLLVSILIIAQNT